jgi:hypothetical protein
MEPVTTGKIYSAIALAKKGVEAIGKNRKNTQQGYNFRGIDDAMDAFSPLLSQHGLTIVCDAITHLSSESVLSKGGGNGWRVVNNYSFRIYADDGSFIQGQADGEAIDYGDKCTTKAQSVALREFIFKTFMVPFHTVDDIEEVSHEITKPTSAPVKTIAPKTESKPVESKPKELDWMKQYELDNLIKLISEGKYDGKTGREVANIARLKYKVNKEQAADIEEAISNRPKDLTKEASHIFTDPKAEPTPFD